MVASLLVGLSMVLPTPSSGATTFPPGDLSRNGRLEVQDLVLALRMVSGLVATTPQDIVIGDVAPVPGTGGRPYGDGRLDIQDVLSILRRLGGLSPGPWPVGEPQLLVPASLSVNTAAALTQPIQLSTGYLLSGHITDLQGKPVAGLVTVTDTFSGQFGSAGLGAEGDYSIVVSPGTYNVWVTTNPLASGESQVTTRLPVGSVTVLGRNLTADFTRPALPPIHTVTGTLQVTDSRYTVDRVGLVDGNTLNQLGVPGNGDQAAVSNNSFTADLPAGTYQAVLHATAPKLSASSFSFVAPWSIQVGAGTSLTRTLPSLAHLGGTVKGPDGQPLATGIVKAVSQSQLDLQGYAIGTITKGAVNLWLGPGVYGVTYLPNPSRTTTDGIPGYTLQGVSIGVNTTRSITLPAYPALKTFTGSVVDASGQPVVGAAVRLASTSLSQVSSLWGFTVQATTNATGEFSVKAPVGRYNLTVIPPGSLPVVGPPMGG
jgi:hypothetical protein